MRKSELTRRIHAYDFAIYEMVLYLDTHPDCARGLEKLARLKAERAALINEYERHCGKYIEQHTDACTERHWNWIDGPWPWENEANK